MHFLSDFTLLINFIAASVSDKDLRALYHGSPLRIPVKPLKMHKSCRFELQSAVCQEYELPYTNQIFLKLYPIVEVDSHL